MRVYILTEEDLDNVALYSADWWKRNGKQLVMCKDCKHHVNYECEMWDYISTADDYWCKDGERLSG